MQCLERIMKNAICEQVKPYTDCYQLAYTKRRCVDDATLCLTEFVLKHVDKANTSNKKHFAKIVFIEFF